MRPPHCPHVVPAVMPAVVPAVTLALVLLVTSACGLSPDGPTPSRPVPASPTPTTPTPTTPASTGPGGTASPSPSGGVHLPEGLRSQPAVAAAIADTAARASADPDDVVIAAWSPVTFTDGSMGCAKKGMSYTQALVKGEVLLLRVGSSSFQYHAGTGKPFAYCADPSPSYTVEEQ